MIVVVGLSHKTAPLEVRERLAIAKDALPSALADLRAHDAIGEAVVLSTCNRVEVYASPSANASDDSLEASARAIVAHLSKLAGDRAAAHLHAAHGPRAVRHLFRVAASLDSLVVGEPQILGQLKEAIEIAKEHEAISSTLQSVMHRAVRVGKRVRTETQIGSGQVSVSSVAIDLAKQIFGDLAGKAALLVGAGEMAEAAAKLLVRAGAKLVVVNRSPERAKDLAAEVGGEPRAWSELERSIALADIVVSSTSSPGYVVTKDLVKGARKARKGRSLFLIDIAVPRDVEPSVNELDNVFVYDVDDLSQIVADAKGGRAQEASKAEAIVEEEAKAFEAWTREQALVPAIVKLRSRTRAVLAAEIEKSLGGRLKHLGKEERDAMNAMLDAMTNKLLHAPSTKLKSLAHDARASDYVEALHTLFDLHAIEDPEPPARSKPKREPAAPLAEPSAAKEDEAREWLVAKAGEG